MTIGTVDGALAPAWLVCAFGSITLLFLAGHVLGLAKSDTPAPRRRIRLASGLVMMLMVPLASFALGFADPLRAPREFVLAWMLVAGLLVITLALAGLDVLCTWRLRDDARHAMLADLLAPEGGPPQRGA